MIVIRPGLEGFDAWSLMALASMIFISVRDLTTRTMPRGIPALLVALVTGIAVCLTGPFFGLVAGETWIVPDSDALLLMGGAAVFLIGGYLFAVDFMRHGDISVVAPFRYTVIIWAMIVGYLVFSDVPDLPMLIGTEIIIATGIYTFHRERMAARLKAEAFAGEGM